MASSSLSDSGGVLEVGKRVTFGVEVHYKLMYALLHPDSYRWYSYSVI